MIDYGASCCRTCPSATAACVTRPASTEPIAIVLDHPSEAEHKADEWLKSKRGGAGELLRQAIAGCGYDVDELYVCSALNCRPNTAKPAMVKRAMIACRDRLVHELKAAKIEKVLCVGPVGFSALTSHDKLAAITKVRGRWKQAFGMNVMATLPPGFVIGTPDYFRDFAFDLEKFFSTDGPMPHPNVDVWRPDTATELHEAFAFLNTQPFVSCDLETTGFSPIACDVLAAGFGTIDDGDGMIVVLDEALLEKKGTWRGIAKLLSSEDVEVVFHNAKFDLQFLKQRLSTLGLPYAPAKVHDTMLLHYLLDERPIGRFQAHGLESISRVMYDAPDYGINIGKWLEEWKTAPELDRRAMREQLHVYLGLDCYYTARLFPDLWNACLAEDNAANLGDDWGLLDAYENLLMPGSLALADIEHYGIKLDVEMFERTRIKLDKEAKKLLAKLQRKTGIKDLNPGSPQQVQRLIYNAPDDPEYPGLGQPFGLAVDKDGTVYHTARRGGLREGPTAAPVLKSLAFRSEDPHVQEIVDLICEYRNITKNAGTYVTGLLQRVDQDGRLRTNFNLAGTSTGRLSSSGPNLQNIPDASHTGIEIRGGFIAPPGRVFVYADYKQLEVRIAAWLSGDPKMREVFESGRDPHQEIAFSIYNKPKAEISHYMRWLAKNILFGLLYGRGPESVATGPEQEDIVRYGGKRWTVADVKQFFNNLLAEWEVYADWQASQRAAGYRDREIRMPTGRKRRFPFIPKHDAGYVGRAAFNNPTQGTASDFTLNALIRLHHRLPAGAHIVLTVHDSIMVECEIDQVDEVTEIMRTVMEDEPLFETNVPLAADIEVFEKWAGDEFAKAQTMMTELDAA